jgi:uncharacterized protein (TIGR04255 family)
LTPLKRDLFSGQQRCKTLKISVMLSESVTKERVELLVWRPLHPRHAIERARIIVIFKGQLPAKFLRKLASESEERRLELGFSSMNWREGHTFKIGNPAASVNSGPTQLFGWDWQNLSSGNVPLETLILENENLIYETVDYTHWANFSSRFEGVALPILEKVLGLVDISNLVLEYVDRFVFDGPATEARAEGVLSEAFVGLPEAARTSSAAWHSHLGWFDEIEGHSMLINQNVDAQDGRFLADSPVVRSMQIYTKTDLRPIEYENGYEGLRSAMSAMHVKSKQLVYDILTPEMRQRIGMEGSRDE